MSGPLNREVIISAATRLFRVCVRLYPRRFRVEYGAEMEALFRRRMIRASSAGSAKLMSALLNATFSGGVYSGRSIGSATAGAVPSTARARPCGRGTVAHGPRGAGS